MKLRLLTLTLVGLGLATSVYAVDLKTETDKVSYSIGYDMATKFKQQGIGLNPEVFSQGLTDGLAGTQPALSMEEQKTVMEAFQKQMVQKMQTELKALGEQNAIAGKAFLEKNRKEKGVKVTKSGLQYKVVEQGEANGPKPTADDIVTVDYEGSFIDGTVFDSSYKRGKPVSFPLNGVIPGWTEGLQLMPVGSTYMFYIPSKLAYGEQGAPGAIPPNKTLIFKVKLISIEKAVPVTAATTEKSK